MAARGSRCLIAGLGNPGARYEGTRHNAGFSFIEALARRWPLSWRQQKRLHCDEARLSIDGQEAIIIKPTTFMNESGQALRAVSDYYDVALADALVAYDDLDLPPGEVRLRWGGGHGGHNGLRSAFSHWGDQQFWRLRIGIGHPGLSEQVHHWVLSRAGRDDEAAIDGAIDRAVAVLPDWLAGQSERAQQALHTRPSTD
jgi:PTH1 family peptidyl-tRNA hydrolase